MHRAYDREWQRLEPGFLADVDAGRMTAEEAGLALHREIWRTIAPGRHLRYDQVESSEA